MCTIQTVGRARDAPYDLDTAGFAGGSITADHKAPTAWLDR